MKSDSDDATRYCADALSVWTRYDGRAWTYSPRHHAARLLAPDQLHLLSACRELRTIPEHAARLHASLTPVGWVRRAVHALFVRAAPEIAKQLRSDVIAGQLRHLADAGLMITERDITGGLVACECPPPTPLDTIAIPTHDRQRAVIRCLRSLVGNANRHGRRLRFLIVDGKTRKRTEDSNDDLLRRTATPHTLDLVGRDALENYATRLARRSGVDERVVRWAICPDVAVESTVGASRNAILLAMTARRYLQFDDDMVCCIGRVSASHAIRVTDRRPTETRYFRTRRDAVRAVNWIDEDGVAIHERILGRRVPAIVRESPSREVRCEGNGAE